MLIFYSNKTNNCTQNVTLHVTINMRPSCDSMNLLMGFFLLKPPIFIKTIFYRQWILTKICPRTASWFPTLDTKIILYINSHDEIMNQAEKLSIERFLINLRIIVF